MLLVGGAANGLGANALRLAISQQQQVQTTPVSYTSASTTPQNSGPLGEGQSPIGK